MHPTVKQLLLEHVMITDLRFTIRPNLRLQQLVPHAQASKQPKSLTNTPQVRWTEPVKSSFKSYWPPSLLLFLTWYRLWKERLTSIPSTTVNKLWPHDRRSELLHWITSESQGRKLLGQQLVPQVHQANEQLMSQASCPPPPLPLLPRKNINMEDKDKVTGLTPSEGVACS